MPAFRLLQASDYADSAQSEFESPGAIARPFVHGILRFTCDGPTIYLRVACGSGASTNEARIAVYCNGVFQTSVLPTTTLAWYAVTVPAANGQLVECHAAQQSGPAWPAISGSWVDAVSAPNLNLIAPPSSNLVIGLDSDSLACSQTNVPGRDDWPSQVRASFAARGRLFCNSWGFRGIGTESNHAAVALLHHRAAGPNCTRFRYVMAMGTNDYGVPIENDATFLTNLTARLAAFRTEFGTILEQMYLITPFPRGTETVNGLGSTMANYRTQVASFAGANRCTIIDGTAMGLVIPTDYFADNLHLADTGHAKISAAVFPVIGGA